MLDDPIAPLQDQILGAVPIAAPARAGEPPIVLAVEVREDAVLVGEHHVLSEPVPELSAKAVKVVRPVVGSEPCRPISEPGGGGLPARNASSKASIAGPSRSS